jgi:hypothetical protein
VQEVSRVVRIGIVAGRCVPALRLECKFLQRSAVVVDPPQVVKDATFAPAHHYRRMVLPTLLAQIASFLVVVALVYANDMHMHMHMHVHENENEGVGVGGVRVLDADEWLGEDTCTAPAH